MWEVLMEITMWEVLMEIIMWEAGMVMEMENDALPEIQCFNKVFNVFLFLFSLIN